MKKLLSMFVLLFSFVANAQENDVKYNVKIEVVASERTALVTLNSLQNVDSIFLGILTADEYTEEEGDYYGFSLYKLKNGIGTQVVNLSDVLRTDGIDSLYTLHPVVYFKKRIQYPKKIRSSYGDSPAEVYPLCFTNSMLDEFRRKQITIKAIK